MFDIAHGGTGRSRRRGIGPEFFIRTLTPNQAGPARTQVDAPSHFGIALGYEDLNDHGELRGDAVLSLLVGKRDVTGAKRIRERDRGYALASASTLNRMELGEPEEAANHRYQRIVARTEAFDWRGPCEGHVELHVERRRRKHHRADLRSTGAGIDD